MVSENEKRRDRKAVLVTLIMSTVFFAIFVERAATGEPNFLMLFAFALLALACSIYIFVKR